MGYELEVGAAKPNGQNRDLIDRYSFSCTVHRVQRHPRGQERSGDNVVGNFVCHGSFPPALIMSTNTAHPDILCASDVSTLFDLLANAISVKSKSSTTGEADIILVSKGRVTFFFYNSVSISE
ncbi:hypothetical protein EMMF5_001753 [Cystobasidiomycetes sp. EMM_F5]